MEVNHTTFCPIGPDKNRPFEVLFVIHLNTKIPPDETFDPYPIIEPIINSIDWAGH
jgi:hypothetical protein